MSRAAQALFELQRLALGGAGALTDHLLHELAAELLAPTSTHTGENRGDTETHRQVAHA